MILISKNIKLCGIRYIYKISNIFNKKLHQNFLLKLRSSYKRLIILRSPKHFNIGKLQLLQSSSHIIFYYPIFLFLILNINLLSLHNLKMLIPLLPTTYLTHLEVKYIIFFKFSL